MFPVTMKSLTERRLMYSDSIKDHEERITEIKEKIQELDSEIERLKEYEKTPIEERTLIAYLDEQSKTVKLFDQFDSLTPEGYYRYGRMLIRSCVYHRGGFFDLIVERLGDRESVGDITVTEFKREERSDLDWYIDHELNQYRTISAGETIMFSKPYYLRAQNSKNRSGYGSEYYGDMLVREGTPYGETTKYCFAGVICTNAVK